MSPSSRSCGNVSGTANGYGSIEHEVSKMDTLAGIAIKYGVEVKLSSSKWLLICSPQTVSSLVDIKIISLIRGEFTTTVSMCKQQVPSGV